MKSPPKFGKPLSGSPLMCPKCRHPQASHRRGVGCIGMTTDRGYRTACQCREEEFDEAD